MVEELGVSPFVHNFVQVLAHINLPVRQVFWANIDINSLGYLIFDLFKESRRDPGFEDEPAAKVHTSDNPIAATCWRYLRHCHRRNLLNCHGNARPCWNIQLTTFEKKVFETKLKVKQLWNINIKVLHNSKKHFSIPYQKKVRFIFHIPDRDSMIEFVICCLLTFRSHVSWMWVDDGCKCWSDECLGFARSHLCQLQQWVKRVWSMCDGHSLDCYNMLHCYYLHTFEWPGIR